VEGGRGRESSLYRLRAAGIYQDVRPAGHFADPPYIPLSLLQRQIASDRDDPKYHQFPRRGKRQQDCHRVVDAWIGID
jgi:hypothetical protein